MFSKSKKTFPRTNSRTRSRRLCGFEALESRTVMSASPVAALARLPSPNNLVVPTAALTATAAPLAAASSASVTRASVSAGVALHTASAGWQYTAFSVVNNSTATVAYSIKWGNGSWTKFTLVPHSTRTHYIQTPNQTATISYDKSFASGYQEQQYRLTGTNITFPPGFYLVAPTPAFGAGKHYTFGNISGGVRLYS
ncbi:MAG: hypothetical protein WCJ35_24985 [Planctomycetota bacterium]